jgi:hypothetical protein
MPEKTIKTTKSEATKSTKTTKAAKDTKAKPAAKSAAAKPAKASASAKPEAKTAAKTTKAAAKPAKPTAQAVKDARESNRLRQQRFLEKHRDEINVKRRERYAERKEGGKCPRCGKKLLKSSKSTLCKDCLEKAREYNQR